MSAYHRCPFLLESLFQGRGAGKGDRRAGGPGPRRGAMSRSSRRTWRSAQEPGRPAALSPPRVFDKLSCNPGGGMSRLSLALGIFALALPVPCLAAPVPVPTSIPVTGWVGDAHGRPLVGARVTLAPLRSDF